MSLEKLKQFIAVCNGDIEVTEMLRIVKQLKIEIPQITKTLGSDVLIMLLRSTNPHDRMLAHLLLKGNVNTSNNPIALDYKINDANEATLSAYDFATLLYAVAHHQLLVVNDESLVDYTPKVSDAAPLTGDVIMSQYIIPSLFELHPLLDLVKYDNKVVVIVARKPLYKGVLLEFTPTPPDEMWGATPKSVRSNVLHVNHTQFAAYDFNTKSHIYMSGASLMRKSTNANMKVAFYSSGVLRLETARQIPAGEELFIYSDDRIISGSCNMPLQSYVAPESN